MDKVSLVSLFSGLGGAELLMEQNYLASKFLCSDLGLAPPMRPRFLFACDYDVECIKVLEKHHHPPETVIDNLFKFLNPACIARCHRIVDASNDKQRHLSKQIDRYKGILKKQPGDPKTKAKLQETQDELKSLGEDLLVSLVRDMSKKGSLKLNVVGTNGKEARRSCKTLGAWMPPMPNAECLACHRCPPCKPTTLHVPLPCC